MKRQLLLLLFSSAIWVHAQITFHKTFGGIQSDVGKSVQQTSDEGYIITGYLENNNLDLDVYLIKTDVNGDTLWTRTFGGVSTDIGNCVQQTIDGGYIVLGQTFSFGAGLSDFYLIKTNSNGDTLWTKTYGSLEGDVGLFVQQTSDEGYIVSGITGIAGASNVYVIKTDANGDTLWTKKYGGTDWINCSGCHQTADGGYIISGTRVESSSTYSDVWLLKTDAYGDVIWSKTYGGSYHESCLSVQQTGDGGYILTGSTYSFGAGNSDVYLIKTDANGGLQWSKTFDNINNDGGFYIQQTVDGRYIISGYTTSFNPGIIQQTYIIKTDVNGDTLWTRVFGELMDAANCIKETSDGGYIICGHTTYSQSRTDIFLVKTNALGNKGCYDQASATTIVNSPATLENVATIQMNSLNIMVTSPNSIVGSGGIDSTFCSTVGINEITEEKFFVLSPNPASLQCTIHSKKFTIVNIEIFNTLGAKFNPVISDNNDSWTIDCRNFSSGIYFVKVETDKAISVQKLVVE